MLLCQALRVQAAVDRNVLRTTPGALLVVCLVIPAACFAQVQAPGPEGVALGHFHFHAADREAHRKFWTDVFGAVPTKVGDLELYKLPGVFIAIDATKPAGGMDGSTVPRIGLRVRDLARTLRQAEALGATISEQDAHHALIHGPEGIRVDLVADEGLATQVSSDSIELKVADVEAARAWYEKTFGRAIPGVTLQFSQSTSAAVPTKGRVLDHIGLEISGLKEFTRKLAASGQKVDLMYLKLPDSGVAIAFVTDPWGTFVELTEGLNRF